MTATKQEPQEQEQQKSLKEETIERIRSRVEELAPLRQEHEELSEMLSAINGTSAPKQPRQQRQSAPAAEAPAPATGVKLPRSGSRAEQVLTVVKANPGLSVTQIGDKMGVTQKNYLYRVVNELQGAGVIRKEGNGIVAN